MIPSTNPITAADLHVGRHVTILGPNSQGVDQSSFHQHPRFPDEPLPETPTPIIALPTNVNFLSLMGIPLLIQGVAVPYILCCTTGPTQSHVVVVDLRSIVLCPLPDEYVAAYNRLVGGADSCLSATECQPATVLVPRPQSPSS